MNFQIGAMVAGGAFVLSFLSGLIGGVPFFDILLRALIWAGVGFGASLGIESLLRSLLPDLFTPTEEAAEPEPAGQSVNITLEEEVPRGGFVEEVDDSEPVRARPAPVEPVSAEAPGPREPAAQPPVSAPDGSDEEMPEIGSFLDAFKPESSEDGEEGASAAPEIGEYVPVESGHRSSSGEVTIDGEVQDPVILAKAVQTVLKRDAQGT